MESKFCSHCQADIPRDGWHASTWERTKAGGWCRSCMRAYYKAKNVPACGETNDPRPCRWCGEEYRPRSRNRISVYCSKPCQQKYRNDADKRARLAAKPPRACVHCAQPLPAAARLDAKFCSAECNSRAHQLKRKLRTRGGGNTGFVRAQIAERDSFTCGICALPVDMKLAYPDPGFASLDHILPVSHGGSSEPENLRLTHLQCNVTRRDRLEVA